MSAQDAGVREPRIRLRLLLVFMRLLAGHRGHSAVVWHGAGFTYRLIVTRELADPSTVELDADPTMVEPTTVERLKEALRTLP